MAGSFVTAALRVFSARVASLVLGVATSIIIARCLGPEAKGIYSLAALLPSMIVTLICLGVGPSTVYHVARNDFSARTAFGNNLILAIGIGALGMVGGGAFVYFSALKVFPGVSQAYLYGALLLIPLHLAYSNLLHVLLGIQQFKRYSVVTVAHSLFLLTCMALLLFALNRGVGGALLALGMAHLGIIAAQILMFRRTSIGISFKLDREYIRKVLSFGWKVQLANIIGFLNLRIDLILVNAYLGVAAVGLYSVGVGLVEKLWLIPNAASTILYPRVSAETDERKLKRVTPLVSRITLWLTGAVALLLVLLCRPIILLLYSTAYLGGVRAAQVLLVGIVAIAVSKPLANDLAGRGRPILNTYISLVALITNVTLNIIFIPRYGIVGAALASTASYVATFLIRLVVYCKISGNRWTEVVFLKREDLRLCSAKVSQVSRGLRKV
jgi:O-antigen/teichoic acid export membrane protein